MTKQGLLKTQSGDGKKELEDIVMNLMNLEIAEEDQGKEKSQSHLMVDKAVDTFKMSLWESFGSPNIDKFGDLICKELYSSDQGYFYLINLVLQYQRKSLKKYMEILDSQSTLLNIDIQIKDIEDVVDSILSIDFLSKEATEEQKKFIESILKNIDNPFSIDI